MFELVLKSSARIYEIGKEEKEMAESELRSLSKMFAERNNPELWTEMIHSAYLSYFSVALLKIFGSPRPSCTHTV